MIIGLSLLFTTASYSLECGEKYRVSSGDTLSSIAKRAYGDGKRWDIIYYANKNIIGSNPSTIKRGQELMVTCLKTVEIEKSVIGDIVSKNIVSKDIVKILSGDNSAPFLIKDSPNGGMITHIVKESFNAVGMNYSNIFIDDFSSHFELLKNRTRCFDVGTNWNKPDCSKKNLSQKTKDRCEFRFSEPIFEEIVSFYQKGNKNIPKVHKNMHGKKICRPKGWMVFDLEEQGLIHNKTITLVEGNSIKNCMAMLESNKIDYVSITKMIADLEIKESGYKDIVEIEGLSSLLSSHLIIHPHNPRAGKIIFNFNKGLRKLKESGKLEEIQTNHLINYQNSLNK